MKEFIFTVIKRGNSSIIANYLKNENPDKIIWRNLNALQLAAMYGQLDIARELLEQKAKVNEFQHSSPLYIASYYGHQQLIELLLIYGASLNTARRESQFLQDIHTKELLETISENTFSERSSIITSHLVWAIRHQKNTFARQIMEFNARSLARYITIPDTYGLLCLAAFKNNLEMVRFLLNAELRLDLSSENLNIRTPLYWAAINNNAEMIELLKQNKASVKIAASQALLDNQSNAFNLLQPESVDDTLLNLEKNLTTPDLIKTHLSCGNLRFLNVFNLNKNEYIQLALTCLRESNYIGFDTILSLDPALTTTAFYQAIIQQESDSILQLLIANGADTYDVLKKLMTEESPRSILPVLEECHYQLRGLVVKALHNEDDIVIDQLRRGSVSSPTVQNHLNWILLYVTTLHDTNLLVKLQKLGANPQFVEEQISAKDVGSRELLYKYFNLKDVATLETIPADILNIILSFLELKDIFNLRRTSRYFADSNAVFEILPEIKLLHQQQALKLIDELLKDMELITCKDIALPQKLLHIKPEHHPFYAGIIALFTLSGFLLSKEDWRQSLGVFLLLTINVAVALAYCVYLSTLSFSRSTQDAFFQDYKKWQSKHMLSKHDKAISTIESFLTPIHVNRRGTINDVITSLQETKEKVANESAQLAAVYPTSKKMSKKTPTCLLFPPGAREPAGLQEEGANEKPTERTPLLAPPKSR